ncbi:hypothetical protein PR048_021371 [Dryococelus australis]|uniref:Uncharacterized protein n=1 Tax=Dryococelus australis TaxID=614101 RepID=A0ABQ9GY63_9NEOP|nr:hypothetical protein PR048_021371 [Dryococelus australis]
MFQGFAALCFSKRDSECVELSRSRPADHKWCGRPPGLELMSGRVTGEVTSGRLDSTVMCILEPRYLFIGCCPIELPVLLHTWQYGTRYLFPCKSAIGPESSNCSPFPRRIGLDSRRGRPLEFCMWKSYRRMSLIGGFSRGSPVSPAPALAFRRCSIITSLPSSDLKTMMLRAATTSLSVHWLLMCTVQIIKSTSHSPSHKDDSVAASAKLSAVFTPEGSTSEGVCKQGEEERRSWSYTLGSPLVDDRPIMNAVKYRVVSGVVWTNRTRVSSNTATNRTCALAVVDTSDSLLIAVESTRCIYYLHRGAAVAERVARSPPIKVKWVQSPGRVTGLSQAGIVPDDTVGRRVFSADFPLPPPLHFGAAPYSLQSPSSTLKISLCKSGCRARQCDVMDGWSLARTDAGQAAGSSAAVRGGNVHEATCNPHDVDRKRRAQNGLPN